MKKIFSFIILATLLIFTMSALAHNKVVVIPMNSAGDSYVPTVTSNTGRIWMDRNLGASQVATSSTDIAAYGDLYQWGRLSDGHESNARTISTLSNYDDPGHGHFITTNSNPYDWRAIQNNNLWQGVSGINNPCPSGFRLPTKAEWEFEVSSWDNPTGADAYNSPLKLVLSGSRISSGVLTNEGVAGYYWSSTSVYSPGIFYSSALNLSETGSGWMNGFRVSAFSVRCVKD